MKYASQRVDEELFCGVVSSRGSLQNSARPGWKWPTTEQFLGVFINGVNTSDYSSEVSCSWF